MIEKNLDRINHLEKECDIYNVMIIVGCIGYDSEGVPPPPVLQIFKPSHTYSKIYFWNNDVVKDIVNKFARLSHDFDCEVSIDS